MISSFSGQYNFLSNFFFWSVKYEGISYSTNEHAYQATKTTDGQERLRLSQIPNPGAVKRAGRSLQLRPDWEEIKIVVMADLLRLKFAPKSYPAHLLLSTGDEHLVEGNHWHDRFWGAENVQGHWVGQNHLGKLLMQIREELRQ